MAYFHQGAFGGNIAIDHLKKHAPVTLIIILINLTIFVLGLVFGLQKQIIVSGAMTPVWHILTTGEYWRFLSAMFIHNGIFHVVFNMIILLHAGGYLEQHMGSKSFALFYLASGLLVSLASGVFTNSLSVGASGAIFALLGFLLYFDIRARKLGFRTNSVILPLVGINVFFTIIVPQISFVGHVSGLVIGYIFAFYKDKGFAH